MFTIYQTWFGSSTKLLPGPLAPAKTTSLKGSSSCYPDLRLLPLLVKQDAPKVIQPPCHRPSPYTQTLCPSPISQTTPTARNCPQIPHRTMLQLLHPLLALILITPTTMFGCTSGTGTNDTESGYCEYTPIRFAVPFAAPRGSVEKDIGLPSQSFAPQ